MMNPSECTLEELREIVEIALDQPLATLSMECNLYNELGMDSIAAVAMVVEVQRRFGVRIPDEIVASLQTPQLLMKYMSEKAGCDASAN